MNDLVIRLETEKDYDKVENVTREAFWNVYRPGCLEHFVLHCYRSRAEFIAELSLIAEKDGQIVGHVMYSNAELLCDNGNVLPIATFGPLSILPTEQGKGYGSALLTYSIGKAKELGFKAIAITGNYDFYKRFGFVIGKEKGILYADDPTADYFLVKELQPRALDGIFATYKDPEGYFVDEKQAEEFDAAFPRKEKATNANQIF